MKVYLVGGAVRDDLLGRPSKDKDYVVVGATPDQMLSLGYKQVGADFPVFLHPTSGYEYALARTERKTGTGYQGFSVNADPSVTLEDDLRRRDLTINAMALDMETNNLVDPFNGKHDLANGVLRHVSEAFAEDPRRVLRVARFKARYGFNIAHETLGFMQSLVTKGEMLHLTPERVWLEVEKGLMERHPVVFIMALCSCDAWGSLFPTMRVGGGLRALTIASTLNLPFDCRIATILAETPINDAMGILNKYRASVDTMRLVSNLHTIKSELENTRHTPHSILQLFKSVDAFRRSTAFRLLLDTIPCLNNGIHAQFAKKLKLGFEEAISVSFLDLPAADQLLKGKDIGDAIDRVRIKRLVDIF